MPKVAILGAGLSGLACAHRLLQYGITPIIYESRHRPGERPPNLEAVVHVMNRPLSDALLLMSQSFGISLAPSSILHTIRVHSPNASTELRGALGYANIRGNDHRSFERQLAAMVAECPMELGVDVSSEELAHKHDYVVIAVGNPINAMDLGIWKTDVEVFIQGAQVQGKFNPGIIDMWLDVEMASQGYAFLAAFDEHNAAVHVAAGPSGPDELGRLWETTRKRLGINPLDQSVFRIEEYKIGRIKKHVVDKFIFVGNAGGFIEPFLGFGQIPSMLSGIYAADHIAGHGDFESSVKWFKASYENSLRLREYFNQLDNGGFDRLVRLLGSYMVRPLFLGTGVDALGLLGRWAGVQSAVRRFRHQ